MSLKRSPFTRITLVCKAAVTSCYARYLMLVLLGEPTVAGRWLGIPIYPQLDICPSQAKYPPPIRVPIAAS
ncbi:hypothetical protein GGS23DRAFT_568771 [Durotheca rogersii]|uniref:uncharacterized protein n=1 Tax=Durotheca rogersii TaxID=419775 RepID=UPI002220D0FC|nr:uncharacterized protein GGS23DRAFT_568771 [Durotheca rogersii]KAI5863216.1 hypothetical protein GGS23DRAFT_568771 [Durotheca rogersii]